MLIRSQPLGPDIFTGLATFLQDPQHFYGINYIFTELATYSKKQKDMKFIDLIESNINQLFLIHFNRKSIENNRKLRTFNINWYELL